MGNKENIQKYKKLSEKLLSVFLKVNTTLPATKMMTENESISYDLGNILVTVDTSQDLLDKIGYKPNMKQLPNIKENETTRIETIIKTIESGSELDVHDVDFIKKLKSKTCSKSCLLSYLYKEIYWIIISILCSSYISSFILMRSITELLVNISTSQDDAGIGMYKRINGITFFDEKEKKSIKKLWDQLCSWSHPYNKWIKNICSTYISHYPPLPHPDIADDCIKSMYKILDIYLVICIEQFEMDISVFLENEGPINTLDYPFFKKRVEALRKIKNV